MVHTTTSIAWGLIEVLNLGTLMLIYYIKAIITIISNYNAEKSVLITLATLINK